MMTQESAATTAEKRVHIEFTGDELELMKSALEMLLETYTRHEHMYGKIHELIGKLEPHGK